MLQIHPPSAVVYVAPFTLALLCVETSAMLSGQLVRDPEW